LKSKAKKGKIIIVAGARPNFIKIAPLMREFKKHRSLFDVLIIHTGQHYSEEMSKSFFNDLELGEPDVYLGVGSGTHAIQTGKIMIEFEKVCLQVEPDLVIVVGDVNSTIACALVAAKLCIPIAHIEAGLRSFDRTMPEEINRILTDQISDYLFTTCEEANKNLTKEGISSNKIFFVGNVMIDTLFNNIKKANRSIILEKLRLKISNNIKKYAIVTIHRPSNVDNPKILEEILNALNDLAKEVLVIFPAHPRTIKQMKKFKLIKIVNYKESFFDNELNNIKIKKKILTIPPLGYFDFLCLMSNAAIVLTDSGGIQEETTALGIPCITLRNNTERPITVEEGTNIIVGNSRDKIIRESIKILNGKKEKEYKVPKLWDGNSSERIVRILIQSLI